MKLSAFIVLLIYCSLQTNAQVLDDFTDSDFTSNPIWTPDVAANWTISSNQLQSNSSTANSTFFISTPSAQALNAQWEFYVNLRFNTSSANFVDVYLTSSNATMLAANGYFVRIGGTRDEISLYKSTAGVPSIIVDGQDGITNSSNNILKIKVIRDGANSWSLFRDVSGTGNSFVSEGTAIDATFTTCSFFGIRIEQSTSSFFSKHFFDDIYAGPIILDTTPPVLNSILVASSTEINLTFNEDLDIQSAQAASNYLVDNEIGTPVTAILQPDKRTVSLTFLNPFGNGVENQLTLTAITDVAGNAIVPTSKSFLFFIPVSEKRSDIIVSELLADPDPTIGLPAAEFIEIYNRSSNPFDLNGWKLTDGSSTATFSAQLILPNQYWIVTSSANAGLFSSFQNVIGVSNFPSLNNSGDLVLLKGRSGLTVDSLNYSLSWYRDADKQQGGWSLERIDLGKSSTDPLNWVASQDVTGGTPGKQNSWFGKNPDVSPPKLVSLIVKSDSQLELKFDESLQQSSLNVTNFSVNNSLGTPTNAQLLPDQKSISLSFNSKFPNGVENIISITNISDLAGNSIGTITQPFTFINASPSFYKDLILTEIFADPTPSLGLPEAEFVELFNRSVNPFSLAGWTFQAGASKTTFSEQVILPNQYVIVTNSKNASLLQRFGKVVSLSTFPILPNEGTTLVIRNDQGLLIDSLNYSTTWYRSSDKSEGGYSLELIDPNNPCGEEDNWIASESTTGGTPGKQNASFANKPDLTGPKLLVTQTISNFEVLLTFDEKLDAISLAKENLEINPQLDIKNIRFLDDAKRQAVVTSSTSFEQRTLYSVTLRKFYDCTGNLIQDAFSKSSFALPEEVEANDILINELLFNPKPTGVDFVEVYNKSSKYISLSELKLANISEGIVKNLEPLPSSAPMLEPYQFKVFTADPIALKNNYPAGKETSFFKSNLPSLPDDEGSIALISRSGVLIDSFLYSEKLHSTLIKDEEGVSLERISLEQPTGSPTNWKSASSQAGFATPGYLNSNARPEFNLLDEKVKVEPEVFIPNSGNQDFAKINYEFDQNNFVANIKILDQQGRVMKVIANNETLGYSGFFRWDGNLEDGTKARQGYYIVWIDLFDETGSVNTLRKRVVVAGR
jgi:hypothetical protein